MRIKIKLNHHIYDYLNLVHYLGKSFVQDRIYRMQRIFLFLQQLFLQYLQFLSTTIFVTLLWVITKPLS